jgi:Fic family protein
MKQDQRKATVMDYIQELKKQKEQRIQGSAYWKIQVEMAYNSSKIEGNRLTKEQTRCIYETGYVNGKAQVNDVIEITNHFRMFDYMLDNIDKPIDRNIIQSLHKILLMGTSVVDDPVFNYGGWKTIRNEVGNIKTSDPENVEQDIDHLVKTYNGYLKTQKPVTLTQILAFHVEYERIHPFLDGNGRTGRIIMFAQCLQNNVKPFIIFDDEKDDYYNGLNNWFNDTKGFIDYCTRMQDRFDKDIGYLLKNDRVSKHERTASILVFDKAFSTPHDLTKSATQSKFNLQDSLNRKEES